MAETRLDKEKINRYFNDNFNDEYDVLPLGEILIILAKLYKNEKYDMA